MCLCHRERAICSLSPPIPHNTPYVCSPEQCPICPVHKADPCFLLETHAGLHVDLFALFSLLMVPTIGIFICYPKIISFDLTWTWLNFWSKNTVLENNGKWLLTCSRQIPWLIMAENQQSSVSWKSVQYLVLLHLQYFLLYKNLSSSSKSFS